MNKELVFEKFIWNRLPQWQKESWEIWTAASELRARAPGKYDTMIDVMHFVSWFTLNPVNRAFPFLRPEGIYPGFDLMYHSLREIDDVADGDRPLPVGFTNFAQWREHLEQIVISHEKPTFWGRGIDFLVASMIAYLEPRQRRGDDVRADYMWFLSGMQAEHDRRVNGSVLSKSELEELNWNSFGASFNFTLLIMRSKYRAKDISELALLLGKAYALRDLKSELPRMCNIPSEVLMQSGIEYRQLQENPSLVDEHPVLINWQRQEVEECKELILALKQKKLDIPARLAITFLSIGARRDIAKMNQLASV